MPRFATAMGSVMLVGREFYRFGYHDKNGASSKVRELGAIPLNIAGVLLMGSLGLVAAKRRTGDFWGRRKFVRYFTHNHADSRLEEVIKKAENAKKGIVKKTVPMLPMHPMILEEMEEKRSLKRGDGMTPSERKRKMEREALPNIKHDM